MTARAGRLARFAILGMALMSYAAAAGEIAYWSRLTPAERSCLAQLLKTGDWRLVPQFHDEMMSIAAVAETHLDGARRKHYIYIMHEFPYCGTAGCSMLIAEVRQDGICHEIYDGSGFKHAISVLGTRDHGYRRLYTPCELRFNGREYRQIHDECPTIDVQR